MTSTSETPTHGELVRALRTAAPDTFAKLTAFDDAALRADGNVLPRKYVELMAIAVALTTQCEGCIDAHTASAKREGATEEELAETVFVATALRAGAALTHGLKSVRAYHSAAH
ncbi:MAG: carboxymuconolactone decarboxylase family protein [Actinomycetales bacterium]|nr:carboxymuconolactone decarboxylase family protein [Actinomycetales bacterium]